ncbi:hypothetical protein T265_08847 [Opisthorchis viverrini]|uniref:N-acetylgalactosaminide beta-1,3-galactosyltransferase n=1 Tax=Opisthorchis viverrini TaxID=6198 RepID=A0A074Z7S5_OPIVI|nr:hypothetical protein T265_08847 [Opisthorchis viverrini]KER23236.1 hypothetical protein T265_08847 [Opisthorchis viverrini]
MTEPEVRSHLWVKMRKILRELYHVADDYDYFYKADDDTYAFVSNLRQFLAAEDEPSEPVMWGYRWMAKRLSFRRPYVLLGPKLHDISKIHSFPNKFCFVGDSPGTQVNLSFMFRTSGSEKDIVTRCFLELCSDITPQAISFFIKTLFSTFTQQRLCPGGYFSGGSGYVLTREALKRIVERAIDRHPDCPTTDEDKEDVKMCLCGRAVGVRLEDGRLENGRDLFYPYSAKTMAQENMKTLYFGLWGSDPKSSVLDFDPSHISFHYIENNEMYIFEFLTYYLRPIEFVI